ncbi:hypothetical protein ACF0H5_015042 [Mactra antiquata]
MRWPLTRIFTLLVVLITCCHGYNWKSINLPEMHIPYYFTNNPDISRLCGNDTTCPYQHLLKENKCWGYEKNCKENERLSNPECPDDSRGWAKTKEEQLYTFWQGGDFGYVLKRREEMKTLCKPKNPDDSSLECAKYMRYCRAKNIYLDLRHADFDTNESFKENFLLEGEIGGHCKLQKSELRAESEHKSALQSWYAEMEHFTSLPFKPIDDKYCDIIIDKPVMFMKLDYGNNMFHHYCNFINFYLSNHVNNSFSTDLYMINWDTRYSNYTDLFKETFDAFTEHPIMYIKNLRDKRVCIKDAVFPLLPRMRLGMFYNMPLESKIRVTFLDRMTKYRNVLNQAELVSALKTVGEYEVRQVVYRYKELPFLDQLKISHNSDIFIGMHGAGLTHMLYQPDWGSVIELFNCGDPNCYLDLARLRGVKYYTWEKIDKLHQEDEGHHPTLGAHQKYTNYAFDVQEFMRLVAMAANHVRSHPAFIAARKLKYKLTKDEL